MAETTQKWFTLTKAGLFFQDHPLVQDKLSKSTVYSWANHGVLSKKTGKMVFLRTRQVGGRRKTCLKYFQKFLNEINDDNEEEIKEESDG